MINHYKTSDLALAVTLSLYCSITSIEKQNPRKAQFIFDRNQELDNLLDRYWKKELLVEPRTYFDELKALKARLYTNE